MSTSAAQVFSQSFCKYTLHNTYKHQYFWTESDPNFLQSYILQPVQYFRANLRFGIKVAAANDISRGEIVFKESNSQEMFWLDMTNSLLIRGWWVGWPSK